MDTIPPAIPGVTPAAAPAIQSILLTGTSGMLVDIECRLSNNLPTIVIVGFANRSVGEARERIRGAFASSHIMLPRKRITVNLAPADVPKADSGFDLAIAVAIMTASGQAALPGGSRPAFIAELGLDGRTRPVRGIIGKLLAGRAAGITTFYIPSANLAQARLVPHIRLVPVSHLAELHAWLSGETSPAPVKTGEGSAASDSAAAGGTAGGAAPEAEVLLSEIAGQSAAKRILEIAAAGGHNLFFDGPPGTGKSMLARALPGLLPPLEREEMLEVTQLHSLAGNDYERIISVRPFRSPHHSASLAAMTGGGSNLRPGEISLAHRGVLFLDELPEFSRQTLESLRQPLETRTMTINRAHGRADYPANFIFVATANPCPCGYSGGSRCACPESRILAYRGRLSGPVLDRIDLYGHVHEVDHGQLLSRSVDNSSEEDVRRSIRQARARQAARFGTRATLNADMTNTELKTMACVGASAFKRLNWAARELNLSARAYMSTVRVARTIADLEGCSHITGDHLSEALGYRPATDLTTGGVPRGTITRTD